jgi:hypothetical protein
LVRNVIEQHVLLSMGVETVVSISQCCHFVIDVRKGGHRIRDVTKSRLALIQGHY